MWEHHRSRFFVSLKFCYLFLFDKLLTDYCNSIFLTCIVLGFIKVVHSQDHISAAILKTLKKPLKSVVLVFFRDFSVELLSRREVAKHIPFVSSNWKFYREHFLMKNCKVEIRCWVPSQRIFEFWDQFMCYSNNLISGSFSHALFFLWYDQHQ